SGVPDTFLAVVVMWLQRKPPAVPHWPIVAVVVGPLFSAYHNYGEMNAANMAGSGYARSFGPEARGTYAAYPLVWPNVALAAWSVVLLCMLTARDSAGYWWHERLMGVPRAAPGVGHGLARIGSFIVAFNVSCLLVVTIPCILVRLIWGVDSPIVP